MVDTGFDSYPLGTYRQSDTQSLGGFGQVVVDVFGPCRAAGHGADEQGRLQRPAQKAGTEIDRIQMQLWQRTMLELITGELIAGRHRCPARIEHDVQMVILANDQITVAHIKRSSQED